MHSNYVGVERKDSCNSKLLFHFESWEFLMCQFLKVRFEKSKHVKMALDHSTDPLIIEIFLI